MPYDENHRIKIDKIVEEINKSDEHYRLGKGFFLDLEKISEITGIDFKKYSLQKRMAKYPKKEIVIDAFYKKKNK